MKVQQNMPSLLSYVQHRRFPQGRCSWMRAVFLGTILFNVRLGNLKLMISTELHKYFGRNTWIEVRVFRGSEFRDTQGSELCLRDTLTVYGVTYYAMSLSFSGVWVFEVWVFETPIVHVWKNEGIPKVNLACRDSFKAKSR